MSRTLRDGYTTGTCAAAAAYAAVSALLLGDMPDRVAVTLPSGRQADLPVIWPEPGEALCCVRKDAGDDPDVTDGALICARATYYSEPSGRIHKVYSDPSCPGFFLAGGEGVGIATREGLYCPVGYPAINPVPRKMILSHCALAAEAAGSHAPVLLTITVPEGARLAEKTFNPRLGIMGGISILGSTGIVHPMSEDAIRETIRLDIRVKAAEGRRLLAVAPGNYGEAYLAERTGLSMEHFIKCSNYIGDTFRMMEEEGIREALLAGHPGKLIKTAGGVLNTHSRYGDRRMEILSDCAREAGADESVRERLLEMNTTDAAAEYLRDEGILRPVMQVAAYRVQAVLAGVSFIHTEVILYSGRSGFLAATSGAEEMAEQIKRMYGG